MAAALDDWAAVSRGFQAEKASAKHLVEAARLADPDPWRDQLREVLGASTISNRLNHLKDLAKSVAELKTAVRLNPDAPEVHVNLGLVLRSQGSSRFILTDLHTRPE